MRCAKRAATQPRHGHVERSFGEDGGREHAGIDHQPGPPAIRGRGLGNDQARHAYFVE
jgi:hypothetical protein